MKSKSDKYNIKIARRCFDILDLVARIEEPLTLPAVSNALRINSNMAYRLLMTMTNAGYLQKNEKTGCYTASLKILRLARKSLISLDILRTAMPYLEMLSQHYQKANMNLGILCQGEVMVIGRIDSQIIPRTHFTPGKTLPFHATGLGKIITCELPDNEIDELVIKNGLKAYTPQTITDVEVLKKELAKVRLDQLARDRGELIPKDNCNAVPVRDSNGRIIAGISMAAFENHMSGDELDQAIPMLSETARKISSFMGFNQ